MSRAAVEIRKLRKTFAGTTRQIVALETIDLSVAKGSFVTLVGASGCGKSTLLRIIAGLEDMSSGQVLVDGAPVNEPGPDRAVVFQSYSLFPWLTVAQNVAFAARLSANRAKAGGTKASDIEARVRDLLRLVHLETFADAYPSQLSGGMQQRVAIARALLQNPAILLMDEPFGALDAQTRELMQDLLLGVFASQRMTIVFVTHDVEEAIFLGDRVVVMAPVPGRIDSVHDVPSRLKHLPDARLDPEFTALVGLVKGRIRATSAQKIDAKTGITEVAVAGF